MNPDRKKLMQILDNLQRDYEAGLISEEKYLYLSDQYRHKIETIEVSDRIRAMQGKEETPSSIRSRHDDSQKYREEKEKLVRKYIHNPETYTVSKKKRSLQLPVHGILHWQLYFCLWHSVLELLLECPA